ncbi:hypothetical protein GYMLUDRAFT_61960 [Collybiopsis luxurians FD-317 M1]|uniref:Secreted protein n=1 Tax=Collybiopsis luxurians FD-317 M1 TaxID=944289 RepID=A0A0D0B0G3_9AGAR|nr:hypothetical protein GYMLUDRAFT_61960 [Collybiopsis luxurians FD-317 M1]
MLSLLLEPVFLCLTPRTFVAGTSRRPVQALSSQGAYLCERKCRIDLFYICKQSTTLVLLDARTGMILKTAMSFVLLTVRFERHSGNMPIVEILHFPVYQLLYKESLSENAAAVSDFIA